MKNTWPKYKPQEIEPRWQQHWEETGQSLALEGGGRPKFYCLEFFPYPSGDGLHVGHCRNYVPTDVLSRFKRMRGYNVLHPMGWDAFGEPTEQHAVLHGIKPRQSTDRNTANFKRQLRMIGTGYDWTREIDSSDPAYYHWTQYFFLLLYRRGLAYRDHNWQWWCPTCMTTLSSHEVDNGVCWRGHTGVTRRQIPAWYFRITEYADQLLDGLYDIDWPEPVKAMQRNWIGRSEGARIVFPFAAGSIDGIEVFTTRPDTLFGATFLVLAPEHPLVAKLVTPDQAEAVAGYQAAAMQFSEVERMSERREKTGVFTGGSVAHPLTGEPVPVWIADYVLPGYGTGAIMAVPAHDERDFTFAREFGLPVRKVIAEQPGSPAAVDAAFTGEGWLINSGPFDGLGNRTAAAKIAEALEAQGLGRAHVQYRMRDWLISRQRYWGAPIPIIHCPSCGEVPVPEDQLPVLLPEMEDFQPDGSGASPLARVPEFANTTCPQCSGPAQRETDTMGGFACSSWYFLRFASPHESGRPFDPGRVAYWLPVDLYVGGTEHAVLHLLYARFWTRVMYDAGLLPFQEPFARLLNQGQLMGPDGKRMSKSRGNVITPDAIVAAYGADTLRLYELFMAPFDQDAAWNTQGIIGVRRFIERLWALYGATYHVAGQSKETDASLESSRHHLIQQIGDRIEGLRFNTMVSAFMTFANLLHERHRRGAWHTRTFHDALETLMILLAPAAPHLAAELWALTGHTGSVLDKSWPNYDPQIAAADVVTLAVQINGKLRDTVPLPAGASEEEALQVAMDSERIRAHLGGQPVTRVIFVPDRILNLIIQA